MMAAAGEILPPFCVSGAAVPRVGDWARRKGRVGAISGVFPVILCGTRKNLD